MSGLEDFVGEYVTVELSGKRGICGYLIDHGLDILVIKQYSEVYYLPLKHMQSLTLEGDKETAIEKSPFNPNHAFRIEGQAISFRKVLFQARGHFMAVNITGNATIHGYLTSIMNDYFVFHSPVYNTIFITLAHVKWLMPYPDNVTPYDLDPDSIPHRSIPSSLPRTFKEQCKKLTGKLVIFDMGDQPNKIGKLQSVDLQTNMVGLTQANGAKELLNLDHLKAAYLP